jgi:hypothetical protein
MHSPDKPSPVSHLPGRSQGRYHSGRRGRDGDLDRALFCKSTLQGLDLVALLVFINVALNSFLFSQPLDVRNELSDLANYQGGMYAAFT